MFKTTSKPSCSVQEIQLYKDKYENVTVAVELPIGWCCDLKVRNIFFMFLHFMHVGTCRSVHVQVRGQIERVNDLLPGGFSESDSDLSMDGKSLHPWIHMTPPSYLLFSKYFSNILKITEYFRNMHHFHFLFYYLICKLLIHSMISSCIN